MKMNFIFMICLFGLFSGICCSCVKEKCTGSICVDSPSWNPGQVPPGGCCLTDDDCKNWQKCDFGFCDTSSFTCALLSTCTNALPDSVYRNTTASCTSDEACIATNNNVCLLPYCNAGLCGYNIRKDVAGCCSQQSDCPRLACRSAACDDSTSQCIWTSLQSTDPQDCNTAIPIGLFHAENINTAPTPSTFESVIYYSYLYYASSVDADVKGGDIVGAVLGFLVLGFVCLIILVVVAVLLIGIVYRLIEKFKSSK